jgi:glucose-6-phosphate isomerase
MKADLDEHTSKLRHHAGNVADARIAGFFETEPDRLQRTTLSAAGIHLDLSKNLLALPTLDALAEMADAAGVAAATNAMFSGALINHTEQRAALHTALRNPDTPGDESPSPKAREVGDVRQRMALLVDHILTGQRRGYSGETFTDVVNIGIGGSHLGPQLACDALRYEGQAGLTAHFLANVDGGEFERIVHRLNPATTLFVVASKSFATVETRLNARSAKTWLAQWRAEPAAIAHHFIAVTANVDKAEQFGIASENIFPIWDWVGGRYSMWSAIGVPIALCRGMDVFRDLLAGAHAMDKHFLSSPMRANLPVMMAMCGIWNTNFLGAESYAVIPYDDRLRYLPDYLQQLEMESNGKSVSIGNAGLTHHSAPVTWGGLGTNAQHAFFQLLHQGTRLIPIDFIVALQHPCAPRQHHDMLVANCIAQAEGLMNGSNSALENAPSIDPHRQTPGNRPSSFISVDSLDAHTLGALIAMYEHKTFVQSLVWDINAFDQWGVELGKHLANSILDEFAGAPPTRPHDPSTAALLERYLSLNSRTE